MKKLLALLLPFVVALSARADLLGGVVDIPLDPAWEATDPREPGQAPALLPTLKYVPKNGARATLMVSLLPAVGAGVEITDLPSLKELNLLSATPFLPSPDAKPVATEMALSDGLGVYVTNEDPALVGKPTPPDEYRMATTATLLLGEKFVLLCTLLHESLESDEFRQALSMLRAVRQVPVDTSVVRHPELGTFLRLPPGRYDPSPMQLRSDPGYFIFVDRNGITLSGWLDQARKFTDMQSFWAKERANIAQEADFEISDEKLKEVGEWSVVSYTLTVDELAQKNLRACRVLGDAWADIHISKTGADAEWKDLETALAELSLVADNAPVEAQHEPSPQERRYHFEHRLLPKWTHTTDGAFFSDLREGQPRRLIEAAADIVSSDYAAAIKVTPLSDENRVLISFAPPEDMAACYHVLIVRSDEGYRYLTLELTEDMLGDGTRSVFGGWTAEGGHRNFGARKYSDAESFVRDAATDLPAAPVATMDPAPPKS